MEKHNQLREIMCNISSRMYEIILKKYFDQNKRLFNLYYEAFKDIEMFSLLFQQVAFSQSAAVLRMMIETISTIKVLEKYPNLQETYNEFVKFRFDIRNFPTNEQRLKIMTKYKDEYKHLKYDSALKFIDYGWLTKIEGVRDCGFKTLCRVANFSDIYQYIDFLNGFVHGTITTMNILAKYDEGGFDLFANRLTEIAGKLFDEVCVTFHNRTNFDFKFDKDINFDKFRELYTSIMDEQLKEN